MSDGLTVVVDAREKRSGLHTRFETHPDVDEVFVEYIDVGDVVVNGDVVFERKTPGDFVGSIKNRRLESQLQKMHSVYDPGSSYVVIEGDMSAFNNLGYSSFPPESARGYVASLSVRWGCVPLFASDQDMLVDVITRIGRKHNESIQRVVRKPLSSPSKAENDFFARTILQLDGVGKSKIEPLRAEFGSVYQLVERATQEDLESVDGIGSKTASSILKQLNGGDS